MKDTVAPVTPEIIYYKSDSVGAPISVILSNIEETPELGMNSLRLTFLYPETTFIVDIPSGNYFNVHGGWYGYRYPLDLRKKIFDIENI